MLTKIKYLLKKSVKKIFYKKKTYKNAKNNKMTKTK